MSSTTKARLLYHQQRPATGDDTDLCRQKEESVSQVKTQQNLCLFGEHDAVYIPPRKILGNSSSLRPYPERWIAPELYHHNILGIDDLCDPASCLKTCLSLSVPDLHVNPRHPVAIPENSKLVDARSIAASFHNSTIPNSGKMARKSMSKHYPI